MIQTGKMNKLKIARFSAHGVYLDSEQGEILLPLKFVPEGAAEGDELEVFIFHDSEDRLTATTVKPFAQEGEFAYLKVKDVNKFGAFMDWGLNKDLLVPYREQERQLEKGRNYIVRLYREEETGRIAASARIGKFLSDPEGLSEGQEVDLMIMKASDLGFKVIVNNRFEGLLYENEIFRSLAVGDKLKGFVKKVREDGKIDISLSRQGKELITDAKDIVLEKLRQNNGFLPYTDASEPNEIALEFGISKKAFKKAVGGLYKERIITLEEDGIRLVSED